MQAFRRAGEQVAMLVNRAALERNGGPERRESLRHTRCAVDNEQVRRWQATGDQVVDQRAPGRLAFPAHVADRQRTFRPSARTPSATSS